MQHGRPEAALTAYHQAIHRQPGNWLLLTEIAWFLTYALNDPTAGVAMAKSAIELNPACSPDLWNTLGDAYYQMQKFAEAKDAYLRALRVNPGDVRGRFNLAFVRVLERRYGAALQLIAEAFALDETGHYFEALAEKQNCAPSVLRFSRAPVELLFLDCDSFDGTAEYLDGFACAAPVKVEVVRVPAEPPVGPGRKDDIVPIRGDFVALLDNDTIVTAGWLERLVSLASTAADVGMVGPMSNHASAGQRVEAIPYGIDLEDGQAGTPRPSPWPQIDQVNRFAREWQEAHPGEAFETESLGGGCVLLKRAVLQKLGTFPTRTPLGTFDTDALSSRVRQAGYRLLGCREVFMHSFGSRRPIRR